MVFIDGKFILWFVLLQSLQSIVSGQSVQCVCAKTHPQEDFCRNDYVLKVSVKRSLSAIAADGKAFYLASIEEVFKGDISKLNFTCGMFYLTKDPTCGIFLKSKGTFLIFGMAGKNDHLVVDECPNKSWQDTQSIRFPLGNLLYKPGCDCWKSHPKPSIDDCKLHHSYLGPECDWVQSRPYVKCRARRYLYNYLS